MSLMLVSCGSNEIIKCDNSPEWNIDKDLENDFWGAVNTLEAQGINLAKLKTEHIEVIFVDEIKGADKKTVAQATKIFGDGIRIIVLRDKWTEAKTLEQQQANKMVMLHEIGHDYLNLMHDENGWDIMNASNSPNKKVTKEEITNSINRMLFEGRKIYDSLASKERF